MHFSSRTSLTLMTFFLAMSLLTRSPLAKAESCRYQKEALAKFYELHSNIASDFEFYDKAFDSTVQASAHVILFGCHDMHYRRHEGTCPGYAYRSVINSKDCQEISFEKYQDFGWGF